ncbi:MAG: undecaprenyldiphospho-muramoylpentapeptide beta-N-acetylglucosaminyltransferase [Candidatus Omnitrophica bacterium]|nr:undecaprenyldiphospho-muramoylpentapeptide beta-N-acetylglucosaminyltransferase [Candidatus Omnitrophota bacterium]
MRILIVTGSSGGHIFPATALADGLRGSGERVLLVLPQKMRQENIPVVDQEIAYIHAANLSFKLSGKNLFGVYLFLLGAWESFRIILKFKPDVVVGFGSLNSIALVFWAWLFRIKTVIHEQNVVCGRANRLLSRLVDKVAISFTQTRNYLDIASDKIVLTGNPLRKDLLRLDKKEALDFFGFKDGKFTILIIGGSQGSHRLNAACLEALSSYRKGDLQIIHICGSQDFAWLKSGYAPLGAACQVFDFFAQMQYAYSAADLIICRAGATTIAELQKFRVPAILVPYPFAYAHQLLNAEVLASVKSARIIPDQDLTGERLTIQFEQLITNPRNLELMRQGYAQFQELDAVHLLAREVLTCG